MRTTSLVVVCCVAVAAYAYGVYSHAYRSFPLEEVGAIKRAVLPDRGRQTAEEDAYLFSDTSSRQEIACDSLRKDTPVILTMGQSNAANYGESRYRPKSAVYNFNWLNGRCYRAEDPLLGATGNSGSIWSRLGDALIAQGASREVLFVPVAVGGTAIRDWAGAHGPAARGISAARSLAQQGLKITHVLWQQGAADEDTAKAVYERLFKSMVDYLRAQGLDAPIFVAVETICSNRAQPEIQAAQRELPLLIPDVFPGPDADSLDRLSDRVQDGCHYSERGLQALVQMWSDVIMKYNSEMMLSSHRARDHSLR